MSKVKMSPAFIAIVISRLSVTVYISCIRHCLGAPLYFAYFVDLFSLSNLVNNDDVIIRAMTIVKTHDMFVCLAPSNFGDGIHPGFRARGKRSTWQGCRLPFLCHIASNLLRVALQD